MEIFLSTIKPCSFEGKEVIFPKIDLFFEKFKHTFHPHNVNINYTTFTTNQVFVSLLVNVSAFLRLQLRIEIQDLIGIFEHVFDKLRVEPSKHKVSPVHRYLYH